MDLGRLYGPAYRKRITIAGVTLRSIVTDIEVLTDALDAVLERWDPGSVMRDAGATLTTEYSSVGGKIPAEKLDSLGSYDRNNLSLYRTLMVEGGFHYAVSIQCQAAQISVSSLASEDDERFLADYILNNSTSRPTWGRLRPLLPLLVLPAILIGYVGMLLTVPLNGFAQVLILAGIALAVAASIAWSRNLRQRYEFLSGTIRVRGQSRKETNAERANRHANIRVGLATAVITAPVSILVTLLTGWLQPGSTP